MGEEEEARPVCKQTGEVHPDCFRVDLSTRQVTRLFPPPAKRDSAPVLHETYMLSSETGARQEQYLGL